MALPGLRGYGTEYDTINNEKRKRQPLRIEKLTALLNQRMHKAFGLTNSHPIIEDEVESFVMNNRGEFSEIKFKKIKQDIAKKLEPEGIFLKTRQSINRFGNSAVKAGMGIVGLQSNNQQNNQIKGLSKGSRHSMSVKSFAGAPGKAHSIRSSNMSQRTSSHRSLAESDEWREIQNFNSLLHLEEQNNEIQREKDRHQLMKNELDKQIREKKKRERQERETEKMYEDMQRRIYNQAEKKETLKVENMKRKIEKDKESRDKQIIMENIMRKGQLEREKAQEAIMLTKLKKELELEKLAFKEQKTVMKKQVKQMIAENTNAQYLAKVSAKRERDEDEKMQKEIMKKLEAQQMKEANDSKKRKQKQQDFVDKMATDVFDKIQDNYREEELKTKKYSDEYNTKQRLEEERRIKKQRERENDMKHTLARQVKDKRSKEEIDKEIIEEQAALWKMDREQFAKVEEELNRKMKDLSYKNAQLLEQQIDQHKNGNKGMDEIEYMINKGYLKGIRTKKHEILNEEV